MSTQTFGHFEGLTHVLPLRVYFADTDAAGMVYHGRYIEFAERGRSEFLAGLGYGVGEMSSRFGVVWVISDIQIRYLQPGRVDDVLEVVTSIASLKSASVTMTQVIQRVEGDQRVALARASVKAAVVSLENSKPRRFDPAFKAEMQRLVPPDLPRP